ncbi:unnamed protein product [Vicia faba]|uniref:Myb-like domain-containing protein n=1 Tax=Vicia faba TaxID=3906 RepID=A0AAV1AET2_VICFA|nr:unnamed protein product [Vicia faba]
MSTLSKQNKRSEDREGETIRGDSTMFESDVVDPPLAISNDDQHLVKRNIGEGGEQGKKKKRSEERKHDECNQFKRDECEDDDEQGKKMKKKKKLIEGNTLNERNDFSSNEGEVNDQGKKMKKKKEAKAVTNESPNSASKPKRKWFFDPVIILWLEGCWKIIAQALPHRPAYSVYNRGHVLFENNVEFHWTPDEREFVRKAYEQHGPDSRAVADALGKSRDQVKDLWRRIKYTELKRGAWSQDEYQTLFNLVNQDLRVRALEPYRKSQHGMLRDNISWEAISHKLKTRDSAICCLKWYNKLVSPMIANGEWMDSDDFRLIGALYALDACCMEEVDWDNLIEHRSGDVCRQRWDQMVQHIGKRAGKSFIEQVEILAKRFCPDLLEAREAFENKPVIC